MREFSKEFNFLLTICKSTISKHDDNQVNLPPIENIDWVALLNLATRHRVRPLLFMGLKKYESVERIPLIFREKLKAINFQITTRNLSQTKELIRLFQLFKNQNIEVISYKGIVLAQQAYQNIGAREFTDIDLLIHQKDFESVKKILLGQHYEWKTLVTDNMKSKYFFTHCEHGFHYYQNGKRQYAIDLHWLISGRNLQLAIDFEMFKPLMSQDKSYPINISNLSPEGLLLTTCLHHFGKDESYSIRNICDIVAILNRYETQMNWQLLLAKAKEWKIKNILLLGIGVSCTLFSVKCPKAIQKAINSKKIKYHIDKYIQTFQTLQRKNDKAKVALKPFTNPFFFHLSIREHLSTKLKIIFHSFLFIVLPNTNDLKENPNANYWYLLFRKPFRLINKHILSNKGGANSSIGMGVK